MAAVDYFLKIEGIDGESTAAGHKGEIDVLSWSWGETQSGSASAGGGGTGKVSMQDFHFTMHSSKASPKLFLGAAMGTFYKEVMLTGQMQDQEGRPRVFSKCILSDVLIHSYDIAAPMGAEGAVMPVDQVSLNFIKIEFTFNGVSAGFDLRSFKKV